MINTILEDQNSADGQHLLKARQQVYAWASTLQVIQLVVSVALPVLGTLLAVFVPPTRPYVSTAALMILLLDVSIIDRWLVKLIRQAAVFSELFDCKVLQIPWNGFVAEEKPAPESVSFAASNCPTTEKSSSNIRDWYPIAVGRAPLHIARVACQRSNLRYDAELRQRYSDQIIFVPVVAALAFALIGLIGDLLFADVVLSVAVPMAPLVIWSLREHFRNRDNAKSQRKLQIVCDGFLKEIKAGSLSIDESAAKSRELQDAIYLRRRNSPLIMPLVYWMSRKGMERDMNRGADEVIKELGY